MNGSRNTVGADGPHVENKSRATERLHEKLCSVLSHLSGLNSSACDQLDRLDGGLEASVCEDECGATGPGMLSAIDQIIDALAVEVGRYERVVGRLHKL